MFEDREEAGSKLALKLKKIIKGGDFVVVALLRGGIVLGKRIEEVFKIPLVPLSVKKIGAPLNPELAIGAVAFDKTSYFDKGLIKHLNVGEEYIKSSQEAKWKEAETLQKQFPTTLALRGASNISLQDKKVVIVDDGIATGATAICASFYIRRERAKEIILATPVISKDTFKHIKIYFDKVIALKIVSSLTSVSQFYKNFPQVSDDEVIKILSN